MTKILTILAKIYFVLMLIGMHIVVVLWLYSLIIIEGRYWVVIFIPMFILLPKIALSE